MRVFAAGTYVAKQYTILNATGGLGGTHSDSLVNTNLPSGFRSRLSYDANNAFLNCSTSRWRSTAGLNGNQQNVANALVNFFNTTGGIPLVFGTLTPAGLTQVSGETATGSQQTTFDAMTQFMGLMTDPFTAGRGDGGAQCDSVRRGGRCVERLCIHRPQAQRRRARRLCRV